MPLPLFHSATEQVRDIFDPNHLLTRTCKQPHFASLLEEKRPDSVPAYSPHPRVGFPSPVFPVMTTVSFSSASPRHIDDGPFDNSLA